ncbi:MULTISPECIES: hypothetical protein [Bradyrhizobium]|uniref:hypothetical protein n=1 Tax=Bradyrhizobium elkanii TaxID=29448 RepID=UPI00040944A2|nr:hypothetical protein [Bradyrhizobium elkanii]
MSAMLNNDPHILLEMPDEADCRFVGSWLLKVAEAQTFWSETLRDPAFKNSASALCWWCEPNLECAALESLSALRQRDPPFHSYKTEQVLAVDLDFAESGVFATEFAIMVQLGFFALAGDSYRMTVPESVTHDQVQHALLKVASTEVDGERIQPESLLHTLPQAEAVQVVAPN